MRSMGVISGDAGATSAGAAVGRVRVIQEPLLAVRML